MSWVYRERRRYINERNDDIEELLRLILTRSNDDHIEEKKYNCQHHNCCNSNYSHNDPFTDSFISKNRVYTSGTIINTMFNDKSRWEDGW